MHCKYCGYGLKKGDKACPNCNHVIENSDINYTKNNSNVILFVIILLLLGVIIGGYFYVTKPDVMFNTLINKIYKSANKEIKNYEQTKADIDMSFNIYAGDEYKDILDIVNNIFRAFKKGIKKADYVSSKDNDVNKNTMIINNNNKDDIISSFVDNLLNSNDFINVISKVGNVTKEEVIKGLNELKETEELEEEIRISIYTKMLTNDFVKLEVGTKEEVVFTFTRPKNNVYKIESFDYEGSKFMMTITQDNDNKFNIVYNIELNDIKFVMNMNISYTYNEKIQIPLTKESVFIDELTEEDTNSIMENLMQNEGILEIVEVVQSLMPEEDDFDDEFY